MSSFFSENNVSYYTLPIAFVLALSPRFYSGLTGPGKKYFDPTNPRKFIDRLEKADGLDKKLRLRFQRAEACSSNGFEGLPLFAAAVTAGNAAQLSPEALNFLSVGYVVSRVVYTWWYIFVAETAKLAIYRPHIWGMGIGCIMTLFIKAGLKSQP